jgi:hypothetical protein
MIGSNDDRWKQLCEQAAKEQDPKKLVQLVKEINDLLEAKRKRLNEDGAKI